MIETKAITPTIRGVEGDDGTVSLVFATLGVVDRDGDVTLRGAFGRQEAVVVPCHDWSAVPIGRASIREQGAEAIADIKLNLAIPSARDWHAAMKFDFAHSSPAMQFSFAYDALESEPGHYGGVPVRYLKRLKVHEVSPVLLAAGINTRLLSVKRHEPVPDRLPADVRAEMERIGLGLIRAKLADALRDDALRAEMLGLLASTKLGYEYVEAPAGSVAPTAVAAAHAAMKRYAPALGLAATPAVRWFTDAPDDSETPVYSSVGAVSGLVFPRSGRHEVWINADLDAGEAYAITAHEAAHLAGRDEAGAQIVEAQARAHADHQDFREDPT